MVGAGGLIRLMFGLSYETAVVIVGVAMIAYVLFGGMLATTWVQIVKAVLLLGGAFLLAVLADRKSVVSGKSVDLGGRRIIKKKIARLCGPYIVLLHLLNL